MKGGTRKRGSTWSYYFELGKIDGKRHKKEKGGFATKKEAEAALAKAINEYNSAGLVFEPSEISVSDYLDFWFDNFCKMNLKYNSQISYLQIIKKHLKPTFGIYRLKALSTANIQKYANTLKLKGFTHNTMVAIISTLSGALNYAVEPLHYIQYNPCDRVKYPKYERTASKRRFIIKADDFQTIIRRFSSESVFYIPLMIGYYTGLRIGEVFALTWDDINFEDNTITVNKIIVKRNSENDIRKLSDERAVKKITRSSWYFGTPKTFTSNRIIKFGDTLRDVLIDAKKRKEGNRRTYCGKYTEHYLKKEIDEKGEPLLKLIPSTDTPPTDMPRVDMVCVQDNGEYVSTDSFKYCAKVIHHELGIFFNFHSLRHTHATMLIENGANAKDVQERLGHSNIQTTLNTYVHNTEQMRNTTVAIFERIARIS